MFTTAPRTRITGDDNVNTYITFLSGFIENSIISIDDISATFGDNKTEFKLTSGSVKYEPIADEYILAVYDNKLLIPKLSPIFAKYDEKINMLIIDPITKPTHSTETPA